MSEMNCIVAVCKNNKTKTVNECKAVSFFTFSKNTYINVKQDSFNQEKFNLNKPFIYLEYFEENDLKFNNTCQLVVFQQRKTKKIGQVKFNVIVFLQYSQVLST